MAESLNVFTGGERDRKEKGCRSSFLRRVEDTRPVMAQLLRDPFARVRSSDVGTAAKCWLYVVRV